MSGCCRHDGQPVGAARAWLRYVLSWLWFVPALVCVYLAGLRSGGADQPGPAGRRAGSTPCCHASTARRQFLHDLLCRTELVLLADSQAQAAVRAMHNGSPGPRSGRQPAASCRDTTALARSRPLSICVYCGSRPGRTAVARRRGARDRHADRPPGLAAGLWRRPRRADGRGGRCHAGGRRPRGRRHPAVADGARTRPPRPERAARRARRCTSASA